MGAPLELVQQVCARQLVHVSEYEQVLLRVHVRHRRPEARLLHGDLDRVEGLLSPSAVQGLVQGLTQRRVRHHDVHDLICEGDEALRMLCEDERLAQAAMRYGRLDDDEEVDGGVQLVQPQLEHVELVRERHHVDDTPWRLACRPRCLTLEVRWRPREVERLLGGGPEDEALEVSLHVGE